MLRKGVKMAGSPRFKVYDAEGVYQAATRYAELAAAVVALLGDGSRIKLDGRIVWREGTDGHAGDSYDQVAAVISERVADRYATMKARS